MATYPKPSLTVDTVVLAGSGEHMSLLVIERGKAPYRGLFAFPGGFVDPYELPLSAAVRELREETGLQLPAYRAIPLSPRTKEGRDPRGWTISLPFLFHLPEPLPVEGDDDARQALWIPLADLASLAFDHGAVLCEALGRFWPEMPGYDNRLAGIKSFGQKELPSTFYGGSFNPWHEGHAACLRLAPGPVVVLPDYNPFKTGPDQYCYWRFFRELKARIAASGAALFPGFCGLERANPTVSWFTLLSLPNKGLLLGDDSFADFPSWTEAETLARSLDHLYVVPRAASRKALDASRAWFRKTAPHVSIRFLDDHPFRQLSSTLLRNPPT